MIHITGVVVAADGRTPVPGAVVRVHLNAPRSRTRRPLAEAQARDDGTFGVEVGPEPGVDLVVTAGNGDEVLASVPIRAAHAEERLTIALPGATGPSTTPPRGDAVVAARAARAEQAKITAADAHERRRAAIVAAHDQARRVDDRVRGFQAQVSATTALPGLTSRFVPPGDSILEANAAVIGQGLKQWSKQSVEILVSPEEGLRLAGSGKLADLKPAQAELLIGRPSWPIREVVASSLLADLCAMAAPVTEDCLQPADEDDGVEPDAPDEPDDGPDDGEPTEPAAPTVPPTVASTVATLLGRVTAPELGAAPSVRPLPGDIDAGVAALSLRTGPADAPAVHDFHQLHIAFDDVWTELFDQRALDRLRTAYAAYDDLGLDPDQLPTGGSSVQLRSLTITTTASMVYDEPPPEVTAAFDITKAQWKALSVEHQEALIAYADDAAGNVQRTTTFMNPFNGEPYTIERPQSEVDAEIGAARRAGQRIVDYAQSEVDADESFLGQHHVLDELAAAMDGGYRFRVFGADRKDHAVNFGIITTFRQRWVPQSYQAGELVKTVPLAPKEARRYTKKTIVRTNRSEKEVANHLESRRSEMSETARAETEIVQKAAQKTNYQMSAKGGVSVGIANVEGSTAASNDAALESAETKKAFREAVLKASQEYRAERTMEINVGRSDELADEESGEISNPNDELAVTYLFYELQRRYKVSERLHRVVPVVLVAQDVPAPSDLDEDWVIRHDWILRRVVLDDSFVPAMDYLATRVVGDEKALRELRTTMVARRRAFEDLKDELVSLRGEATRRYSSLERSVRNRAQALEADESEGWLEELGETFMGSSDTSTDAARIREDAARDAYERAVREARDVEGRVEGATASLQEATERYTRELAEHLNRRTQISRLLVHLRDNILHYMQAIWSHEPPDQRYFRLFEVPVPKLEGTTTYTIAPDPDGIPMPPSWTKPHKVTAKCTLDPKLTYQPLHRVADLDDLLGFKGNYMMFPMKEGNALTDHLMLPYLSSQMGLQDPDILGSWTLSDLGDYVCCLKRTVPKGVFESMRPGLLAAYQRLLGSPNPDGEEVIIPTGSLFIEALPGTHPILEDFKLLHRSVDVRKAQSEVRAIEMENVRLAARILTGELDDPTTEKTVWVDAGVDVDPTP